VHFLSNVEKPIVIDDSLLRTFSAFSFFRTRANLLKDLVRLDFGFPGSCLRDLIFAAKRLDSF
jgi:hypothetical protein